MTGSNQVFCSIQVAIQQLRDRLTRALGQQGSAPGASVQTQRTPSQLPAPRAQLRHPYTQVHPTMVPQPTPAAPVPMPISASAPAQPQYYQPVCSAELPLHLITVFTHRSDSLGSYLSIIYSYNICYDFIDKFFIQLYKLPKNKILKSSINIHRCIVLTTL